MGLIEIIQYHMPISHCPCRRRSIGPLPSCSQEARQPVMSKIVFESDSRNIVIVFVSRLIYDVELQALLFEEILMP